jgi:LexA-binding, inner membrane-associated putative hydrolase
MTTYEHAMFGASLALVAGLRRRQGWGIVGVAAVAAAVPDWDGLSILFGSTAYANGHRVWGHNVLAASLTGAAAGVVGLLIVRSEGIRRNKTRPDSKSEKLPASLPPSSDPDASERANEDSAAPLSPSASVATFAVWASVGIVAGLTHLPADIVFNGGAGLTPWPVPVFWPFDRRGWAVPIVPWGDITVTLLFVAEMFSLYRWPGRDRSIAALTLAAASAYLLVRWLLAGLST